MTVLDTAPSPTTLADPALPGSAAPARAPRRPPYQPRAAASPAPQQWDSFVDTLPMLRTSDIRSVERLRAIITSARQGIADLDALLAALNPPSPAAAGQDRAR
ncbi:hypothetical protein HD597_000057 [Nonomuraea thailandensis]|uniref:Uncharacterized protein n=1 Tax=Nonomuraea thailandensis TaxID=1188745 RepID=A0A9X2G8K6_9ACTN|nr:hypothetical protein [Nonomuraea thailandensis]MCP2353037.1 hypothetical protein [Nonomuraea thailandensis]